MQILSVRFLWIIDSQTRCSPYFIPKCVVFILRFCHPINCVQGRTSLKWTKKWGGIQELKKGLYVCRIYYIYIWAHSTENIFCQWNRNLKRISSLVHLDISMNFMYIGLDAFSSCNVKATLSFGLTEWDHTGLEGVINY